MQAEWLFALTSLVLLVSGSKLARYGEAIAEKTSVSVTWIGLFLVAAVTSLPELFTGASSILVVDEPDFAVGDVLGSCLFNLLLAALAALATRRVVTRGNDHDVYRIGSAYLTGMLLVLGAGLALAPFAPAHPYVSLATAFTVLAYFVAIRHIFHVQARPDGADAALPKFDAMSRRRVLALYALHSGVVVVAASFLPYFAEQIATARGLDALGVGTILLAASTSLPEAVIVVAAIRQGAPSLAIGGLVGSNLFNLVILALDDLLYARGPLLAAVGSGHLATLAFVGVSTWLLILALPGNRTPRLAPLAGMLVAYTLAILLAAGVLGQG